MFRYLNKHKHLNKHLRLAVLQLYLGHVTFLECSTNFIWERLLISYHNIESKSYVMVSC